jgi:uroporphyrinogen decarboxylase
MSRKKIALDVFNNQAREIVPIGFWFHFSPSSEFANGPGNEALFKKTVEGHKHYFLTVGAPIVKIMTEGYFVLPSIKALNAADPQALANLKPADPSHPWFTEQIELTRQIAADAGDGAAVIYTLFSPISYLAYRGIGSGRPEGDDVFAALLKDHPQEFKHALDTIADDIANLGRRIITEGGANGVFVSVRNYRGIANDVYRTSLAPGEKKILQTAEKAGGINILHICGASGVKNDFSLYTDYPAKVVNWAVAAEKLSLADGKALFPGRAVLGGFDNSPESLLVKGTKQEIQTYTRALLAGAPREGFIIGADCALPTSINYEHLSWVKEIAESL